jgi:aryl-alcohol dehydrogenase-like predicted oxidoreductase
VGNSGGVSGVTQSVSPVDALTEYVPANLSLAQCSLRWILDHEAVSTVIPGSTTPEHIRTNAAVSDADPLGVDVHEAVAGVYDEYVREHVHYQW